MAPMPSPFEAHAFEPAPGERDGDAVCTVCGEPSIAIRHHPTRVRAARALREPRKVRPREEARRAAR